MATNRNDSSQLNRTPGDATGEPDTSEQHDGSDEQITGQSSDDDDEFDEDEDEDDDSEDADDSESEETE